MANKIEVLKMDDNTVIEKSISLLYEWFPEN